MNTIFSVSVYSKDKHELLLELGNRISRGEQSIVFTPNPEILLKCFHNPAYTSLFKDSINIPDGIGVSLFTGVPVIKGRELFQDILKIADKQSLSVYLLGASPKVIEQSIQKIRKLYPPLTIAGSAELIVNEQGLALDTDQEKYILEQIQVVKPQLIFVAFGAPKQEYWISRMKNQFPQTSFMAIGGTLDTFSGVKPLPPRWLSNLGLEWLFRLIIEPKRIVRIWNAVVLFPLTVFVHHIKQPMTGSK